MLIHNLLALTYDICQQTWTHFPPSMFKVLHLGRILDIYDKHSYSNCIMCPLPFMVVPSIRHFPTMKRPTYIVCRHLIALSWGLQCLPHMESYFNVLHIDIGFHFGSATFNVKYLEFQCHMPRHAYIRQSLELPRIT